MKKILFLLVATLVGCTPVKQENLTFNTYGTVQEKQPITKKRLMTLMEGMKDGVGAMYVPGNVLIVVLLDDIPSDTPHAMPEADDKAPVMYRVKTADGKIIKVANSFTGYSVGDCVNIQEVEKIWRMGPSKAC